MILSGVTALDSGFELRMNASSVGLTAVRVATAAARKRSGQDLSDRDRRAIQTVIDDLGAEIRVLRGEAIPDVEDEKSYAFASFALTALGNRNGGSPDEAGAASELEEVVESLLALQSDRSTTNQLDTIEDLFLRAGEMVSEHLGSNGEMLSGAQATVSRR